ncbi:ABC transporter ATP-binding protein [Macrococcus epidermidis]|uniref:ABC transporter ATP-binding protein n=1 Tax=Macrococcus epidermidis TaxID=1902580 RepID=UPI001EF26BE8|nr:ABC transporter ATP-binding protein [Macrococcus epidermidis]MCG7418892.1 ABC transporter ATP-binding protein [Macrococcus epidermidis]UTH16613.1 ABC transporter ATP-binding protein [Macrococcus epidermidis]
MLLNIKNVKKVFGRGANQTVALKDMNFSINEGEFVAIMGESGSGKSTLLNIIATFDTPTEGSVTIGGQDLSLLKNKEVAKFRRDTLGFVFQDFNVLHTMSNADNILMPLVLSNMKPNVMEERLSRLAPKLGISEHLEKFPNQISGGQQQRVAIARALISNPSLLLADEPTGALDSKTSTDIMNLFQDINKDNQTILMVTHSTIDAAYASRVVFIKDGILYHEIYRGDETQNDFQKRISDSLAMLSERGE